MPEVRGTVSFIPYWSCPIPTEGDKSSSCSEGLQIKTVFVIILKHNFLFSLSFSHEFSMEFSRGYMMWHYNSMNTERRYKTVTALSLKPDSK